MIEWPNDARIALMVAPNMEFFHIAKVIPGAAAAAAGRYRLCASRLGSPISVFRMMKVLDKHGIRATDLISRLNTALPSDSLGDR
jgi:hypothetical protein